MSETITIQTGSGQMAIGPSTPTAQIQAAVGCYGISWTPTEAACSSCPLHTRCMREIASAGLDDALAALSPSERQAVLGGLPHHDVLESLQVSVEVFAYLLRVRSGEVGYPSIDALTGQLIASPAQAVPSLPPAPPPTLEPPPLLQTVPPPVLPDVAESAKSVKSKKAPKARGKGVGKRKKSFEALDRMAATVPANAPSLMMAPIKSSKKTQAKSSEQKKSPPSKSAPPKSGRVFGERWAGLEAQDKLSVTFKGELYEARHDKAGWVWRGGKQKQWTKKPLATAREVQRAITGGSQTMSAKRFWKL